MSTQFFIQGAQDYNNMKLMLAQSNYKEMLYFGGAALVTAYCTRKLVLMRRSYIRRYQTVKTYRVDQKMVEEKPKSFNKHFSGYTFL
mmetsp:Transcript_23975/g.23894  ORF Transcript_23975/g.23894 Transcript_23975/m.23894 type:complete len:87 (+) Transcript_23975:291-551(+)